MYMSRERRQYILRLLEQRGSIRTSALARELGVTDETIRTDLVDMQALGLLQRVHGGARYSMPTAPATEDSPRLDVQLAQLVAAHIHPGARIYADAGPMARVLATQLADKPCTFITASPRLVTALAPAAIQHRVICTGGELDKQAGIFTHPAPEQLLKKLQPDFALLCPAALAPEHAAYRHAAQAIWAQAAAACAAHTLVPVASALLTNTAPHRAQLRSYTLFTEDNVPAEFEGIPTETVPYITEASFNEPEY